MGIVLCSDDPQKDTLQSLEDSGLLRITWVESASCEGIAKFLFEIFQPMVEKKTQGRVKIQSIFLEEDGKNSARYLP